MVARKRLQTVCRDTALAERLVPFFGLLRPDLRGLPVVIANGSLYVTESSLRKNTGTHYTPPKLATEVVHHALQPLVYEHGPLQTADETTWVPKPAARILELKVADIAMGSAAFLVAACRYLGDRLIEAWAREEREDAVAYQAGRAVDAVTAADAESDPLVIEARRQIIEHCLYGVDINPMAVEMAKLSLWLVSMDPARPFTFLDDRLIAGDSLLGVTSLEQLKAVHLDAAKGDLLGADVDVERLVGDVTKKRHAITGIGGDGPEALEDKRALLSEVRDKTAKLRLVGDLVAGAALATCASGRVPWYEADGGERLRDLFPVAARVARDAVAVPDARGETSDVVNQARATAREWLASELPEGGMRRVPVHWPLEFPEVFAERGGFDAVVGNPPFLGGSKITGASGEAYREHLVEFLANRKRGNADFVAYFALRAHQLIDADGQSGLIATNTLAQGDTREVGLDQLHLYKAVIRRAIKSQKWPSASAELKFCAVWTTRGEVSSESSIVLDSQYCKKGINPDLTPQSRISGWLERLTCNSGVAFNGSKAEGAGFTLSAREAQSIIAADSRNIDVIKPFLKGRDVTSHPTQEAADWGIFFRDWNQDRSSRYHTPFKHVTEKVKVQRLRHKEKICRERWWLFKRPTTPLYTAISQNTQVIVFPRVSKTALPALVPSGQIFDEQLIAFGSEDLRLFAILSSAPHYWWAIDRASTMKGDLRYTPTDVFETLVRPPLTERLRTAGTHLHKFRRELMLRRNIGLTATYNLVHDETCQDADIVELRRIHEEIDNATVEAYGWHDLLDETGTTAPADPTHETFPLDHGFHDTDQGPRYTIGLLARTEIIDRLRQLNHQAYSDEVFLGLHKKPKTHPDMPPASAEARRQKAKQSRKSGAVDFEDDGLFRPDDTLF